MKLLRKHCLMLSTEKHEISFKGEFFQREEGIDILRWTRFGNPLFATHFKRPYAPTKFILSRWNNLICEPKWTGQYHWLNEISWPRQPMPHFAPQLERSEKFLIVKVEQVSPLLTWTCLRLSSSFLLPSLQINTEIHETFRVVILNVFFHHAPLNNCPLFQAPGQLS